VPLTTQPLQVGSWQAPSDGLQEVVPEQAVHASPPFPQLRLSCAVTHCPFAVQQPLQLLALQEVPASGLFTEEGTQTPLMQLSVAPHALQVEPLVPHARMVFPSSH